MTISAKVIADSISERSPRLTTLQLRYPKFIHGEFMTHRVFSRNASSSRAIPVERMIKDVIDDPVYPMHWGKNQPGMQADDECSEMIASPISLGYGSSWVDRERAWDEARKAAIAHAKAFADAGYHKQIVNRLLEPFVHINVVVTATDWSNFFALRCHKDAQPEMRLLAEAIRDAMKSCSPNRLLPDDWHVPYVTREEATPHAGSPIAKIASNWEEAKAVAIKLSVARCARVSYLTQDGKVPTVEDDLKLYDRLLASVPLHASPAEHQASPDHWDGDGAHGGGRWRAKRHHGNLRGWVQYRKTLPGETQ